MLRKVTILGLAVALFVTVLPIHAGPLTVRRIKGVYTNAAFALTGSEVDGNITELYTSAAHGLAVGDLVYKSGASSWAKAISTAASTYADGVVVGVLDANNAYISVHFGQPYTKTAHGLGSAGTAVYLSAVSAGAATATVTDQLIGQVLDANTIIFGAMGGGGSSFTGSYSGTATPLVTFDQTSGASAKTVQVWRRGGTDRLKFVTEPIATALADLVWVDDDGTTETLDVGCSSNPSDNCWVGNNAASPFEIYAGADIALNPTGLDVDFGASRAKFTASCIDEDSDRLYGDKDCDSTKDAGEEYLDEAAGAGGNSFETINAPAGTDPVADSSTDTLNVTCAGGLTCTGTAGTDTLDFTMGTAATATALAANGTNCTSQAASGVDASGNAEGCTTYIGGSTGATDNALLRADGTGGATAQSSALTVADTTGNITGPSGGFSVIGGTGATDDLTLDGSAGTAGNTVITEKGNVLLPAGTKTLTALGWQGDEDTGFYERTTDRVTLSIGNSAEFEFLNNRVQISGDNCYTWGSGTVDAVGEDTGLCRNGAGDVSITAGTTGVGTFTQKTANGAERKAVVNSESITLSTSGATTDSAANLLPANSVIKAVTCRITTTITTATDWKLGDATTAGRFAPANATLTSDTTTVGLTHVDQTGAAGPIQTAAAKLRITTTGTPGAGVMRCTVFADSFVAPTS